MAISWKRSIPIKIGDFFLSRVTLKSDGWSWKTIGHLFYTTSSLCIISKPLVYSIWSYSPETLNSGKNWRFFLSHMTLKIDRWPWKTIGHFFYTTSNIVHHFKSISEVKLELQSRNAQFGSKLAIFCHAWPWNLMDDLEKIGHLFYTTLSLVQHFKAIGIFKLELQSGKAQFGSKLAMFLSRVTLKIDGWPW